MNADEASVPDAHGPQHCERDVDEAARWDADVQPNGRPCAAGIDPAGTRDGATAERESSGRAARLRRGWTARVKPVRDALGQSTCNSSVITAQLVAHNA
jgi:hypothetical protein